MIDQTSDDGYIAACEALRSADLRETAKTIRVPTMIIASELDQSTPPTLASDLHASIEGSELVMIANAAHLSNVEQPVQFNAALARFLGSRSR